MIDQIVTDIAAQVTAKLPFVKGVKQIARQDPTGIITKEGPEEWAGIDDAEDGRLYIRFRDGWDRLFTDGRMISGENLQVTDRMRGVFMHYCENEHEIARALTFGILHSVNQGIVTIEEMRPVKDPQHFFLGGKDRYGRLEHHA